MKVKEFYEYITKHLTAEEALLKLLEGASFEYEKLKYDDQQKAVHPLLIMLMASMDMGWVIALDKDKEKEVRGICAGTEDYMETIFLSKR